MDSSIVSIITATRFLLFLPAITFTLAVQAEAQSQSMVCKFLPRNAYFGTTSPEGGHNELPPNRHCPVRITMEGNEVKGEKLCPEGTIPKAFKGTAMANRAYPGNVIVLWADNTLASASLWAISFERREVGVSYAFSAHYTEVGAQWLRCSN